MEARENKNIRIINPTFKNNILMLVKKNEVEVEEESFDESENQSINDSLYIIQN